MAAATDGHSVESGSHEPLCMTGREVLCALIVCLCPLTGNSAQAGFSCCAVFRWEGAARREEERRGGGMQRRGRSRRGMQRRGTSRRGMRPSPLPLPRTLPTCLYTKEYQADRTHRLERGTGEYRILHDGPDAECHGHDEHIGAHGDPVAVVSATRRPCVTARPMTNCALGPGTAISGDGMAAQAKKRSAGTIYPCKYGYRTPFQRISPRPRSDRRRCGPMRSTELTVDSGIGA